MAGMPEIGSKISLLSKADIRYEGKLFTVDPEECTIALASVRSFGTEDRQVRVVVPPQNTVFDYILFRGQDIKDIRVLTATTTIPNDPAIMTLSVPPTLPDPKLYSPYQSQVHYNTPGVSIQNNVMGSSLPLQMPSQQQHMAPSISEGESDASTPVHSPNHKEQQQVERCNVPYQQRSREYPQQQQHHYQQRNNYHRGGDYQGCRDYQTRDQTPHYQRHGYQQDRLNVQRHQQMHYVPHQGVQQQQGGYDRRYNNGNNVYNNYRGGRGGYIGTRGRYQHQHNYGGRGSRGGGVPRLTAEEEYDFEQANNEFEEMRNMLKNAKLGEEEDRVVNGEENEKEGQEDSAEERKCYDRVKSFFDQISYESIERSKMGAQRIDWKKERKINSETFGLVALKRPSFRGGYYYGGPHRGNQNYRNYSYSSYRGAQNQQRSRGPKNSEVPATSSS